MSGTISFKIDWLFIEFGLLSTVQTIGVVMKSQDTGSKVS